MDFHGDHTSTCIPHSGSSKSHDWMVSVLGHVLAYVTNSTGARELCARPSLPHVSAGHTVRTQHGCGVTARAGADVTTSAGQRRGDVEMCVCCLLVLNSVTSTPQWIRQPEAAWGIRNYLREQAGSRTLVFDFSVTLERCRSMGHLECRTGCSNKTHTPTQDLDAPLRIAAQRKINSY